MRILIIGASGLVGGNCQQYFATKAWETIGTHLKYPTPNTVYFNTLNENDVNNYDVLKNDPQVIIHCGALTNVDYCETNEEESYKQTVQSTANIIELAKRCQAKLVYISTDYVFDGANGPYTEEQEVNPINIYGRHKLDAEKLVQESLINHLIIRITNVYGNEERNKNFVARILQSIANNAQLTMNLPNDQYATPINASDIAKCIYVLLENNSSGIYHIASTDFYNRVQLTNKVLSYFPDYHNFKISHSTTAELKQPARRPLVGGLLSVKFLKENPSFVFSNLDEYLHQFTN